MIDTNRAYLEALAKHLPPSAATLRLLDVNGAAGDTLRQLRADLEVIAVSDDPQTWASDADAITGFNPPLTLGFLSGALAALRPGGRLILVDSERAPDQTLARLLEQVGFVRILVEPALPGGDGVLMRGEKTHTTDDTLARIQQVAARDETLADFAAYTGRYVYLLIRQTPNKPVWTLQPGENIRWEAASLDGENGLTLLAFSGLPRAVGFMQPAVLQSRVRDISKVARFSRETARSWTHPALLNPPVEILEGQSIVFVAIDPNTAEAPGE